MANLAVLIFGFVFLTQIVSWIGKSVLQELAFSLYSRLFLTSSSSKQQKLRKQVLSDKAELARTSSQDEFAKWAKLKRKLDKGLADLEILNTTLTSSRSTFTSRFSTLLWVFTTGAQLVLVWWYRKRPVFWLPPSWVPGPVGWVLSLPSAPSGSVSSATWCAVCKRVLTTIEEIFKDVILTSSTPNPIPIPTGPIPATSEKQGARIEPIGIEHDHLD